MPRYLIYGQTGKTLGATYYQLGTELKAVQASFRRENLGMDRLTWTTRTVDLEAGETIMPDVGQIVELHYDSGSGPYTRLFRGWVTEARHRSYGTTVVVDGPWSWLRRMDATSDITLGVSDKRPTMIFNSGAVATHLATVINRAISEGAPLALGTIGTTYSIPKLQLSQMSYADVIAELLRWVPDAVAWWDYQTNPTGAPIFRVTRRGSMSTLTLAAGDGGEVEEHDITGRPDQVPARVELKYVSRSALGLPTHEVQASGTATAGRTQVILISGKEGDTFLPADDYQSYQIQTYPANSVTSSLETAILPMLPEVLASRLQFTGRPTPSDVILANGETVTTKNAQNTTTYTLTNPTLKFIDIETGLEVSRVGKHFVTTQQPPDWAGDLLAGAIKVRIVGRFYKLVENGLFTTSLSFLEAPDPESWVNAFPWTSGFQLRGYRDSFTNLAYPLATVIFWHYDFEIETWLTTTNYSLPVTVYKEQPFEYLAPPSGLAANLVSAQNFTPYDGRIRLKHADPPMGPDPAAKVDLTGAQTELATMGALQRASTVDLLQWTTEIELGPPARFDFKTLSGRIRQTAQTNIELNT